MKNILISGGSGFIGKKLTLYLEKKGYQVAWLSRNPKGKDQRSFLWDVEKQSIDEQALAWCDGLIHLAGAGVADKRWTEDRKKEILESRTLSTRLLHDTIHKLDEKPAAFISASGVNYYGFDNGDQLLDEDSPPGNDFLAEVVVKWEEEVQKIQAMGIRTVIIRTGMVLGKKGGALPELMKPPVAAPLGTGKQYMSWIHVDDLAALYYHALTHETLSGIYNGVAPHPVLNKTLTQLAAKEKGKPYIGIPVPKMILKVALGEMANMVTGGNKVSSAKLEQTGFKFRFPYIKDALKEIYGKKS